MYKVLGKQNHMVYSLFFKLTSIPDSMYKVYEVFFYTIYY